MRRNAEIREDSVHRTDAQASEFGLDVPEIPADQHKPPVFHRRGKPLLIARMGMRVGITVKRNHSRASLEQH
jgi:hypothetical protein